MEVKINVEKEFERQFRKLTKKYRSNNTGYMQ